MDFAVDCTSFQQTVLERGRELYRDLPWRTTCDPYAVLVSEVMLQQTQVSRVEKHWDSWLAHFPTVDALAAAPVSEVLAAWQGMGYNRRALALKQAMETCAQLYAGNIPCERETLLGLSGVGPATAAGVRVFAFSLPDVYLETNVRTVFLHEFFPSNFDVSDKEIIPLVQKTCDVGDPRTWYYALLDYGAYLKRTIPNPSRRSKHYTRQSAFEGSRRQKRAWLLREIMARGEATTDELTEALSCFEQLSGRDAVLFEDVASILCDLAEERFLVGENAYWSIAQ